MDVLDSGPRRGRLPGPLSWLLWPGLLCLAWLAGCTGAVGVQPTRMPVAQVPTPAPTYIPAVAQSRRQAPTAAGAAVIPTATARVVPTPAGTGIPPIAARQFWVPDAGPQAPAEWRPPPMDAPLSLHPDDHYWLQRPIPSGSRNYDLEWYPFGHDVMLPELYPYRIHHGVDFPNDPGTPVLAAGSGTVIHAGTLPSPRDGLNYYGNTIVIKHDWQWRGQDVYTLYAHTLEMFVQEGETVQAGQLLAGVGETGLVSGPHLHLEVRVGSNHYGYTLNPALWLVPFEGWGTLAGRFVDKNGRLITGATIMVFPASGAGPTRLQKTYDGSIRSDPVWRENFVVGDLPAGEYILRVDLDAAHRYRREVTILPGQTAFEVIGAPVEFVPTVTPTATPGETADDPAATPSP